MAETTQSNSIVRYMGNPNVQENIQQTLKDRAPQFVASVAALVNSNPKIAACEKKSILSSCLIAASLDLPINQNLGFAYIIPYKVKIKEMVTDAKTGKEIEKVRFEDQAQFQMGWRGFVQLAIRTEKYKAINVRDVREGELGQEDFLSGEIEFNWQENRDKLPIIGYVAYFKLTSGFQKVLYMSVEQLRKHGQKYSKSYKYGQWTDDPDGMMRKTVLKLLLNRYGLMTSQLAKAIESDQAVIKDDKIDYPDNEPVDPREMAAKKERDRIVNHIHNATTIEELEDEDFEAAMADQDQDVREILDAKKAELKGEK